MLALLLGSSIGSSVAYADEKPKTAAERVAELEKESAAAKAAAVQLQIVVDSANARVDLMVAQRDAAAAAVDALRLEIQLAEQALVTSAAQLDLTRADIARLGAEIALQTIRLAAKKAVYAAHLRVTYREQQISPLEMLLSTRSLADFSARLDTLLRVDRDDARQAQEIRTLTAGLQTTRGAAAAKETELVATRERIAAQRTTLLAQRTAFENIVRNADQAVALAAGARDDAAGGLLQGARQRGPGRRRRPFACGRIRACRERVFGQRRKARGRVRARALRHRASGAQPGARWTPFVAVRPAQWWIPQR